MKGYFLTGESHSRIKLDKLTGYICYFGQSEKKVVLWGNSFTKLGHSLNHVSLVWLNKNTCLFKSSNTYFNIKNSFFLVILFLLFNCFYVDLHIVKCKFLSIASSRYFTYVPTHVTTIHNERTSVVSRRYLCIPSQSEGRYYPDCYYHRLASPIL